MPVRISTSADITRLTPTEKLVAETLVTGASNRESAQQLGLSKNTVDRHLGNIRDKTGISGKDSRPARAHALLASGQVAPPPAPTQIPDLTPQELRLLRARAEHSDIEDVAQAAGIHRGEVRERISDLVAKTRARNDTHLIGLGHAWGLLTPNPRPAGNTQETSNQPSAGAL